MHERADRRRVRAWRGRWLRLLSRRGRTIVVLGALGVVSYVASWAIAGALWEGYSPVRQAISETFAIGAPLPGRILVSTSLVASGGISLAFAWVLHAAFPTSGRRGLDLAGPVLATASGALTVAAAFAPCTLGCPGAGTTTVDTMHTVVAGTGYLCLILAPAAFGLRVRGTWPRLAWASIGITILAMAGFALHTLGVADDVRGALQRTFNTLADAWYVAAAVVAWRCLPPDPGRAFVGAGSNQPAAAREPSGA